MYTNEDICELYKNKKSVKEIVLLTKKDKRNIYQILRDGGFEFESKSNKNRVLGEEIKIKIIDLYNQGLGYRKIQKEFPNIGKKAIFKCVREAGIVPSKYTYSYQDDLFSILNFDNSHLLGYIFADACLASDGKPGRSQSLMFGLSEKDYNYLEYIRNNLFKTKVPITTREKGGYRTFPGGRTYFCSPSCRFSVHSKKIIQDCVKLGLEERKSYSDFTIPQCISDQFVSSFILGFFEGDGTICLAKNLKSFYWGIIGQENFILKVQTQIKKQLNIDLTIVKRKKNIGSSQQLYFIQTNKISNLIKIYHWLYKDASFAMQRKHDKWVDLLNLFKSKGLDVGEIYNFQNCAKVKI